MKKPRLTPQQGRWLYEVHCNVVRGNRRGQALVEAFSDIHDSNLTEAEVAPLVRQRLLRVVATKTRARRR